MRRPVRPGRRRPPSERGAVALFTALLLVVLLGVTAFAVDLGVQRVARRDMQALADVVSMDLSRELDGRSAQVLAPLMPGLAAAAQQRNADTLGTAPVLDVDLGSFSAAGVFTEMSGLQVPNAVRVTASTEVAFAFAAIFGQDSGSATRASTAMVSAGACFRLGSITATIDTADSTLLASFGNLVGGALGVRLDAVSYKGLADTFVSVADVAAEMGVGSVEELVALRAVRVADFFAATGRVLARNGSSDAAADAKLLNDLAARVSTTLRFDVADILSVGGIAALSAQAGVLDLITASAFAINGDNLLDTGIIWKEPHVSTGAVRLKVIEPPQQACGMVGPTTEAHTAQVQFSADVGFALPNKVGVFNVTNLTDPTTKSATLSIRAALGGAKGHLTALTCGAATSAATAEEIKVLVSTLLADASVSLPFRMRGTVTDRALVTSILGPLSTLLNGISALASVSLVLDLGATAASSVVTPAGVAQDTPYTVPPRNYSDAQPVPGSRSFSVPHATPSVTVNASTARLRATLAGVTLLDLDVDVGALDLSSILADVSASVIGTSTNAVIDNVNEALVPAAELLGIRTGGADLFAIPRPLCAVPRLAG